jgi:integrase
MAHLQAYRTRTGERRFRVRWREGARERSRSFHRRTDARRFALEAERRTELGNLYESPPQTLEQVWEDYRERYELGKAPSTVAQAEGAWKCLTALQSLPVPEIGPGAAQDAIAACARRAPRQAQLALGLLKRLLRDAAARGQRVNDAVLELRAPAYDERPARHLSLEELDTLCSWCSEPRLVRFAALSGLRQGEVFALREADLNLEEGYLVVSRGAYNGAPRPTKSKRARRVHLAPEAVTLLREQLLARPPGASLVFPSPRGGMWRKDNLMSRVFRPATRRAGLEGLRFHDLRHTFASLMIAAGANPLQIARSLGHLRGDGSPDATLVWQRYGHLYPDAGAEAAVALGRLLEQEQARRDAKNVLHAL